MYAYIEHKEDDTGGRKGYIIHVNAEDKQGAATVSDGKGYLIFASGQYYHGQLKGGKKNGYGTTMYASGSKYEGEYRDSKKHGQGTLTYLNGEKYVGEWRDDNKHGKGTFTHASGNKYVGEYRNDKNVWTRNIHIWKRKVGRR